MVEEYGDWFTHDKTSRAKIFEREENKVVSMASYICDNWIYKIYDLFVAFFNVVKFSECLKFR